jgi:hypothetical protein
MTGDVGYAQRHLEQSDYCMMKTEWSLASGTDAVLGRDAYAERLPENSSELFQKGSPLKLENSFVHVMVVPTV